MNKCPKCNILIVPYDIDKYHCKDCNHKWTQEDPGGRECKHCGDVVMYCTCY